MLSACANALFLWYTALVVFFVNSPFPEHFAAMGFRNEFVFGKFILGGLVIYVAALTQASPLSVGGRLYFIGCYSLLVPSMTLYCGMNLPHQYMLITGVAFTLVGVSHRASNSMLPHIHHPIMARHTLLVTLSCLLAVHFALLAIQGQLKYASLNLARVYELRDGAAENLPHIYYYLNSTIGKIVAPAIVVLGLLERKHLYVWLGLGCGLTLFALTSHKSAGLFPLVSLIVFQLAKQDDRRFLRYLIFFGVLVVTIATIDLFIAKYADSNHGGISGWFSSLFPRRALLTPALLNSYYIDYFGNLGSPYYFSHSVLGLSMSQAPTSLTPPNLIGSLYLNNEGTSANAGFIGAGMSQIGMYGVVLYSIIVGVILRWLDDAAIWHGYMPVMALGAVPILVIMTTSDLPTSMLTHGIFALFILLAFGKLKDEICIQTQNTQ